MQLLRTDKPLTPSWNLVRPSIMLLKENIWPVIYLSFLPSLLTIIGLVLMGLTKNNIHYHLALDGRTFTGILLFFTGAAWTLLAFPGLIVLQLRAVRGEHPTAMECFRQGLPRLLPFIAMAVIGGSTVILGLIALIIPGLILFRGIFLAQYYLVDQKLGPVAALKQSFADSRPHAGYIWGIIGVEFVFGAIGSSVGKIPVIGYLLSLGIGLLYSFAPALRYSEIVHSLPVRNS